jgi:hypothetical protein
VSRRVRGRAVQVSPDRLVIADGWGELVQVRLLLPTALDLRPLVGTPIAVELAHDLSRPTRPTVDAVLRDARGRLLVWAHDGALPGQRGEHGLAVRVTHDSGDSRLVVAGREATVSARAGSAAELVHGRANFAVAALRVDPDGASFLVVRS